MALTITIAAFLLSFIGITIANISAQKSKAVRENLINLPKKKEATKYEETELDLVKLVTALTERQNAMEKEIASLTELLTLLEKNTGKVQYLESDIVLPIGGKQILLDQKFTVWYDNQKRVIGQSGITLSSNLKKLQS